MNFINRAFKNVTRKYSKSILLILTFFLIGNLVIVGLGVSNASNSAKILTRKKMRAVVTYKVDYEKVWAYMDSIEDEDER
ncbi:MAG: ABC transporter permease, partial [Erysipelotrichaceae bacterium]|nr:ABC transporter permease [Erysipelotrichaceae bacterium]